MRNLADFACGFVHRLPWPRPIVELTNERSERVQLKDGHLVGALASCLLDIACHAGVNLNSEMRHQSLFAALNDTF
jgi:hypothetical protein